MVGFVTKNIVSSKYQFCNDCNTETGN